MQNKANYDRVPDRNDPRVTGSSLMLKSSSKYLNHDGLRHWVATHSLRRHDAAYDEYEAVLDLYELCRSLTDTDAMSERFREARRADSALDAWFDRAYLADYSDLGRLASLPPGTLGREFYDEFITRRGLKPDFLPDFMPANEADYWLRRAQQIHDIHHILTDSPLDNGGEVRIIGIYMGNWAAHLPTELAGEVSAYNTLLVHTFLTRIGLHRIDAWAAYMAALGEGATMGAAMLPLYLPLYEERWDIPVDRLRDELNIRQPQSRVDTAAMSRLLEA